MASEFFWGSNCYVNLWSFAALPKCFQRLCWRVKNNNGWAFWFYKIQLKYYYEVSYFIVWENKLLQSKRHLYTWHINKTGQQIEQDKRLF